MIRTHQPRIAVIDLPESQQPAPWQCPEPDAQPWYVIASGIAAVLLAVDVIYRWTKGSR